MDVLFSKWPLDLKVSLSNFRERKIYEDLIEYGNVKTCNPTQ